MSGDGAPPLAASVGAVDSKTGAEVTRETDIGQKAAYQSLDALILSPVCSEQVADPVEDTGDLEFVGTQLGTAVRPAELLDAAGGDDTWSAAPGVEDPKSLAVTAGPSLLDEDSGLVVSAGVAKYPFNLTTPNYKAHMSLNFSYEVTNATILVTVIAGGSVETGVVTPTGTLKLPAIGTDEPLDLSKYVLGGHATGKASFDCSLLPRGASQGTVLLTFVPGKVGSTTASLASATVGDTSFELDTWTTSLWPATTFEGDVHGHSFAVNPRYSERQMSDPDCRPIDNGTHRARVCEDWRVIVHSPGDDAETFDVADPGAGGASLMAEVRGAGGGLFDPRRGTHVFHHLFAFNAATVAGLEVLRHELRTNGQFWEQLMLPGEFVKAHPGQLEFRIEDNAVGRESDLLPHADGGAPVSPYVPFVRDQAFLDLGS